MTRSNRAHPLSLVALCLLLVFETALALDWQARDSGPLYWDGADHAARTLKVRHALWRTEPPLRGTLLPDPLREWALENPTLARVVMAPVAGFANLAEAIYRGPVRPPLPYFPAGALLGIFGTSPDAIALAHGLLWFLALIAGTYGLAARTIGPASGILAALLTASMPLLLGQSRVPMLDVPLAAACVFGIWALIESDGFRNQRASLLLGALCGAGMLVKQSFAVVMAGPLLFELVQLARRTADDPMRRTHAAQALFAALLVAGPWYAAYLPSTLRFIAFSASQGAVEGDPASISVEGLLFYPRSLVSHSLGPFLTAAAAVSVAVLTFARKGRERRPVLLALASTFVVFALLHPNKDARYIAPALPLFAVAIASAVARIPIVWLRRAAGASLAVAALMATFEAESWPATDAWPPSRPTSGLAAGAFAPPSIYTYPPRTTQWQHERILQSLRDDRGSELGLRYLFVIEDLPRYADHLNVLTYPDWLRARDGYPVQALRVVHEGRGAPPVGSFYVLLLSRQGGLRQLAARAGLEIEPMRPLLQLPQLPEGTEAALFHHSPSQARAGRAGDTP